MHPVTERSQSAEVSTKKNLDNNIKVSFICLGVN